MPHEGITKLLHAKTCECGPCSHGMVMGLSLNPPARHLCGPLSLAPAAVLLQMKLPASLLGPYSHMPTASGWGWPPPSVPRCRRRRLRLRRHLRSPGGRPCRRDHAVGGGQLRTRWSPLDSVISVAGVCQSLTAPRQHHLTAPDSNSPTSDSSSSLTALTAPTASDSNTRQLRQHLTATEPLACQTCTRQHPTALTAPDSWSDRGT